MKQASSNEQELSVNDLIELLKNFKPSDEVYFKLNYKNHETEYEITKVDVEKSLVSLINDESARTNK